MTPIIKGLSTVTAAGLLLACHSRSGDPHPEACGPISTDLPADASAEELAGQYRLRLVAASGPKEGSSAEGTLWLERQDRSRRYRTRLTGAVDSTVLYPLMGAAAIDLDSVHAVSVGRLDSRDPEQPGVLVIERHEKPGTTPRAEIMLRLGSDANRIGQVRFDGGYTALRVRKSGPEGFAGSWASGITGERAGGYFCAVREDG